VEFSDYHYNLIRSEHRAAGRPGPDGHIACSPGARHTKKLGCRARGKNCFSNGRLDIAIPMFTDSTTPRAATTRLFMAAIALYSLIVWPIIRADRFYIDDLGRSLSGYLGWARDGRPLANVLMESLSLGYPITDIAPIPQVLCLLLLAYVAVMIGRRFSLDGLWRAPLVALPIAANPFYLENLSYKFDSVTMTAAVVFAVAAAVAIPTRGWRLALGALALIASLCLYQAAIDIFLIFALVEAVWGMKTFEAPGRLLKRLLGRGVQAVAALAIYQKIAAVTVQGDYASSHAGMVSLAEAPAAILLNLQHYWEFVLGTINSIWGTLLLITIALGVLAAVAIAVRYLRAQWASMSVLIRAACIVAAVCLPVALVVAPWGPLLLLKAPVFAPRVMLGFGALVSASLLMLLGLLMLVGASRRWQIAVLSIPAYGLILLAVAYGNSLTLQKDYEARIAETLSDDLAEMEAASGITQYTLRGNVGRPPVLEHNIRKFALLRALVPVHLTEAWGWAGVLLKHYGVELPYVVPPYEAALTVDFCALPRIIVRRNYQIAQVGATAVVIFRRSDCARLKTK